MPRFIAYAHAIVGVLLGVLVLDADHRPPDLASAWPWFISGVALADARSVRMYVYHIRQHQRPFLPTLSDRPNRAGR